MTDIDDELMAGCTSDWVVVRKMLLRWSKNRPFPPLLYLVLCDK